MIAEAIAGDGDGAFDYYRGSTRRPARRSRSVHRCEPYVYAQMIAGPRRGDPRRGEELVADRHRGLEHGRDPQWILGIRPEHDGLRIDPCSRELVAASA